MATATTSGGTRTPTPPRTQPQTTPRTAAAPPRPSDETIRRRAYEIYCARKGGPGDAMSDWLQAERELTQKLTGQSARPVKGRSAFGDGEPEC